MRPALAAAAVLAGLIWLLHGVLAPFVAGFILAYIADPAVRRLARRVGRPTAAFIVVFGSTAVLLAAVLLMTPLLFDQAARLVNDLPAVIVRIRTQLTEVYGADARELLTRIDENFGTLDAPAVTSSVFGALGKAAPAIGAVLLQAVGAVQVLTFAVLTPIVAFYLAADFERLLQVCDDSVPRRYVEAVRHVASEVDRVLASYIRGQTSVCVLQALYYAAALSLAGIPYGLFIGVSSGMLTFVPYVGASIGYLAAAAAVLTARGFAWQPQAVVLGIFALGQVLEGYLWVPKLVGRSVGLHPVWVMFGLLALGSLLGFTGLLLAVPLTAACAVPVRMLRTHYMNGPYYRTP